MRSLLIDGIGELVTNDQTIGEGPLGLLTDAAIVVEDGRVRWVGRSSAARGLDADARRRTTPFIGVLTSFVDRFQGVPVPFVTGLSL